MAAPHCLNRAALTRDGGGWRRGRPGGGGDGEEGVGKLSPRRRTDSQKGLKFLVVPANHELTWNFFTSLSGRTAPAQSTSRYILSHTACEAKDVRYVLRTLYCVKLSARFGSSEWLSAKVAASGDSCSRGPPASPLLTLPSRC